MTAGALGEERPTLFLRKATGLVRGWSVRDSMIYAMPVHQRGHAGHGRVGLPVHLPPGIPAHLDPHLRCLGLVPGHRLRRPGGHDPAGGRRLRLAEPHPGQRDRLRPGRHRMVVHPVAVGAHLRLGAIRGILPADLRHARPSQPGRLVRLAQRHLRGHADHDRAGRRAGLGRHGRLRPGAEVVLHRRHGRLRDHRHPAAGLQQDQLHLLVRHRDQPDLRHEPRLRRPPTRTRPRTSATPRPRSGSAARSTTPCCSCR